MGGKTARIKGDLDDVEALLEILNILKDVSSNKFYAFVKTKTDFSKFLEIFLYFFDMLELVDTECPLIRNSNPSHDLMLVTSEAGFMSQLNSRVCNTALKEAQSFSDVRIACVGQRGAEKAISLGLKVEKIFNMVEETGRYESAMKIRDYLVERVMSGQSGGCRIVYVWPKSFNILKPRVVKLLPASELLGREEDFQFTEEEKKTILAKSHFIRESKIDSIMKILADLWVSARIFEILTDTKLAEAATQAQQLEQAVESLGGEKKSLTLSFKKASREELNKAMQEVFTSSKMTSRKGR
ncbi:MAG: F0F1 ATP synthase subunit gamma [Candidatus Omnitrophota bacterium]